MISKYIFPISALLFFISLTSCEDFFETTLELDPPPFETTLVIDCVAHTGQDSIEMRISRNAGILENIDVNELGLNDADVVLTINGVSSKAEYFFDEFSFHNRNNYFLLHLKPMMKYS